VAGVPGAPAAAATAPPSTVRRRQQPARVAFSTALQLLHAGCVHAGHRARVGLHKTLLMCCRHRAAAGARSGTARHSSWRGKGSAGSRIAAAATASHAVPFSRSVCRCAPVLTPTPHPTTTCKKPHATAVGGHASSQPHSSSSRCAARRHRRPQHGRRAGGSVGSSSGSRRRWQRSSAVARAGRRSSCRWRARAWGLPGCRHAARDVWRTPRHAWHGPAGHACVPWCVPGRTTTRHVWHAAATHAGEARGCGAHVAWCWLHRGTTQPCPVPRTQRLTWCCRHVPGLHRACACACACGAAAATAALSLERAHGAGWRAQVLPQQAHGAVHVGQA
jgi:hypothetical protein